MSTFMPTQQTTSLTSSEARLVNMGPADELLDPERHELIMQLLHTIEEPEIDSTAWACLWFADLSNIRRLLQKCGQCQDFCFTVRFGLQSESFNKMIKTRAARSKNQLYAARSDEDLKEYCEDPEEPEIEEAPTKKRRRASSSQKPSEISRRSAEQGSEYSSAIASSATCNERDNNTCVLTGFREPLEVAHIYPYSIEQKEEDLKDFWMILRMFWPREKVETWKKQVSGPAGTESCSNMMCMVNVAQNLWGKARFALKPLSISEDQKVLKVQFYWLPRHSYSREMPAIRTPSPFPGNLSSSTVNGQHSAKLFNIATDTKLCSGDIITFETNDPVGHPLPSMELLNMQWVLHRVLALSGVANATDEDLEPESYQEDTESDTEEE
ncbi:hypothetical protein BDV35DRAFT_388501 [Aspergillus flavus]|nr:hypothetical protein BDV35DRAFT_388501 [Aspergillus flavus]